MNIETLAAKEVKNNIVFPCLVISDGTLEALKWLALLLMTADHTNKYLFNNTLPFCFEIGRLAMPLFVFTLAYNLARPGAIENGSYIRTMTRLALFGLLASPVFLALGGLIAGWWPLNILFTLLAITAILYLIEQDSYVWALVVFLAGGSSVEFWWPSIIFGVSVWLYCKHPSSIPLALSFAALASLWFINGNLWGLAVVLIIALATHINLRIPRLRWFFYGYYPGHLFVLWLIRIPMSKVGYLFF